ncbi:crossveinless d [Carabus blaptoides fortunei]
MGRLTFLAVLTLLYLQWGESALPLPSGKEYVFGYSGVITAKSSASDDHASQWTVDAYLRMQAKGSDIVMKFDDIRTSLFNGDLHNLQDSVAKPIPTEANQLALPFTVHYNEKNGSALSISYQADDPLWSLNIKKAIASIFQLDTEQAENYVSGTKHYEDGIYGKCKAKYSIVEEKSVLNILKTIEDGACVNELEDSWGNMDRVPIMAKDFKPVTSVAERIYRFEKKQSDSAYELIRIESNATIAYQTMFNEFSNLQIVQGQVFRVMDIHEITKPFDVTKNTETTTLAFEFDESDESSGRSPKFDTDSSQIISDIRETYKQFTEEFNKYPLRRGVNNTLMYLMNIINSMADIKENMDLKSFNVLMDKNEPAAQMFISLLPYIGTNDTMQMIKNIIEFDQLNYFRAVKVLATCPKYVRGYTLELLNKMEGLMNPENIGLKSVQRMALMSFAAMVSEANKRADIPASQLEQFHEKYTQLFKDSEDYDDKMAYLSGLINMGSLLDTNTMISIITDDKESHYIRSLAAYGFKPYLASNPEKMFKKLWSIVINRAEHYEVRVAVLDLLMSSDLTQAEFDTIIKEFKTETDDLYERPLQNYLATTLKSLQNTTMFPDYLGAKVADVIDLIPSHYDSWTTGNYRLSYTDAAPNFGGYFQARLVSNPVTRGVNIIQLTSSQFAMSKSLGTYTAYIKLEGFTEFDFVRSLNNRSNRDIPVAELLDILKKFNYKLVENIDVRIEIILFCDDRVVYAVRKDKMEMRNLFKSAEIFMNLLKSESVTFPKMYFGNMGTDLGTHVQTYIVETDIISYNLKIDANQFTDKHIPVKTTSLKFRSSNHDMISLLAYNPLADVTIGVYKHITDGKRVHLPIAFNMSDDSIIIENHSDSLNLLSDKTIGTTVHSQEKLETYCSTCDVDMELPLNDPMKKLTQLKEFGTTLNNTIITAERNENLINNKLIDSYKGNAEAIPMAEPLVMVWYLLDYYRYLGPERSSFESRTVSLYKEPTKIVIQPIVDVERFYNDLINGTKLQIEAIITCKRKSDDKVLSVLDVKYNYMSAIPTDEKTALTQVESKHLFRANFTQHTNIYVMCFDREVKYPNRRPDKLSISPYEPARGKGSFSYGTSTEAGTCPDEISFTFTDIAETAQHVMEKVKNMKEYKTCKKDSDGFKYIPPTDACSTVHDAVSMYTNYTLYLNLKKLGAVGKKIHEGIPNSDDGFKFLESNYISKDIVHFKVSKEFLDIGLVGLPDNNGIFDSKVSVGSYRGRYDPTIVAYQDYEVESGVSATCDITSSKISTFTGKDIENYGTKDGREVVAYVECLKEPFSGMTIQRFSDKKIGFNFWTGNYTLVTSMSGDKLKVALSGEELHDNYKNTNLRIYFLANDVLYITDAFIEVYYNTEFISIKSSARINNFICGLCAPEDKRITGNEVK